MNQAERIALVISYLLGQNPVEPPCSWVPFSAVGCAGGNMESDCAASFGTEAEGVDPTLFLGIISLRLRNKIGKERNSTMFTFV